MSRKVGIQRRIKWTYPLCSIVPVSQVRWCDDGGRYRKACAFPLSWFDLSGMARAIRCW